MKKNIYSTPVFSAMCFVFAVASFAPSLTRAQTVTIGSIGASAFCGGDPISASFTATGYWQHRNAFTLQLSDPSGNFTSGFTNLGSIQDTLPGTFTINATIPGVASSTHYRFRIMGALPYTVSADNGSDITIGQVPNPRIYIGDTEVGVGQPVGIWAYGTTGDALTWDYGSGGTIDNGTTDSVTYSTGGTKTITLRAVSTGGCSKTVTATIRVFDCTPPAIPHDALVISNDTTIYGWELKSFWVNPGVNVTFLDGDENTVFAESGSTISSNQEGDIYYLKQGASLNTNGYYGGMAIYAMGASVGNAAGTLECSNLNFDYTNAPPNAAMPAGVFQPAAPPDIALSPNPTKGSVTVSGLPSNARDISLENVLGAKVGQWRSTGSPSLTLDLSTYSHGTYYLRFLSGMTVVTKKIVVE